MNIHRIRLIVI